MVLAPFFDKPPSMINKPDGSVLFECTCNANPQPTVKWYFKDKELEGDRYTMKVKKMVGKYACTLAVKNPTIQDQGIYKVVATNEHGTHSVEQSYVLACTANEVFKTS
uniref:Ig-like domain-containing protein n=1 Tax=Syphacia muris TaxID=451379 RepID=A0A0N5AW32_9BILA